MQKASVILVVFVVFACGQPEDLHDQPFSPPAQADLHPIPLSDLNFRDEELQRVATELVARARTRGLQEISGRNRVDSLLRLESSLGSSTHALDRVNELTKHLTAADASRWAEIRQRAEVAFADRRDEGAKRAMELVDHWRVRKADIAFNYLSSNYSRFISGAEWERRFHEFIADRPMDAATWGWLLMKNDPEGLRRRFGAVTAELAYRDYLEQTDVGGAREARELFSVPGIEIREER